MSRINRAVNETLVRLPGDPRNLAFVVEYPKCGGTWLRGQIATYRGVPQVTHHSRILPHGGVFQTHSLPRRFLKSPVVLVRDPRDMLVSYYYYEQYRRPAREGRQVQPPDSPDQRRAEFIDYLKYRYGGSAFPGYTMSDFVRAWRGRADVCWVRYEDMLDDPETQLRSVLSHLGDPIDGARLSAAVRANSFQAVTARKPGEESVGEFVRKGVAGDWVNHMSPEAAEIVNANEGYALADLGYVTDDSWLESLS